MCSVEHVSKKKISLRMTYTKLMLNEGSGSPAIKKLVNLNPVYPNLLIRLNMRHYLLELYSVKRPLDMLSYSTATILNVHHQCFHILRPDELKSDIRLHLFLTWLSFSSSKLVGVEITSTIYFPQYLEMVTCY